MNKSKIFDIEISQGRYSNFVDDFIQKALCRESSYVLFMNSHMIYEYYHLLDFKQVVQNADYICPDGMPLYYSTIIFGIGESDRIAGNDMIYTMLDQAEKKDLRIFFYGSTSKILDQIEYQLKQNHPSLKYKLFSPPFRPLSQQEMNKHAELINSFGTHILLVGLGCPKQELWMHQMKGRINAIMLGVGGAFLLYGGLDARAPYWMRMLALEWLYRLMLEPRRLFKRYLITNSYFCWLFIKEIFKRKKLIK